MDWDRERDGSARGSKAGDEPRLVGCETAGCSAHSQLVAKTGLMRVRMRKAGVGMYTATAVLVVHPSLNIVPNYMLLI